MVLPRCNIAFGGILIRKNNNLCVIAAMDDEDFPKGRAKSQRKEFASHMRKFFPLRDDFHEEGGIKELC